ncbi:MAG: phthiocerol/phenolphthiocerol synthesis type-I polyketide synthase [Mycobacterium sp.]|nr:phthiocerol/phenolphthiocerol synthesis type-I polyketide synthase [Mycobacterium sp.]
MTSSYDEEALRHWLADYLVTTVGCSPYDIDFDAPMSDLGLGSRDAVVLSGELSELLGRKVSPVEFWQHPTIADLARFLTGAEALAAEAEVEADHSHLDQPVAVIGLGCRFPGGISGPDEYWQFICEGRNAVTEVPAERWAPFDDGTPEVAAALATTTRFGGYMDNLDAFDAEFFDISSREAAKMDPQQRMLLEVAWEALEHAGIPPSSLRRSQTGVFAGACYTDYGYVAGMDLTNVDAWTNSGGALSIIANRLSYFMDFRGPSVTVDTACSSSIVALHLACQSLRVGDSDVALAAGVNLMLAPSVVRAFDQTGALSPTGACHAFDADADGFIRGEGCGVVVLKRLNDAMRDGDRVLAVVRGSAVNQDGRSNGLLAPNPAAQMAVLRSAYANAGLSPQDVDYVEAHGTGTPLGDPIEARALGTVLGRGRAEDAPLLIGTAKTNLGHLEAAAGVAGLIKTVLAVHRGSIPANLHFHNPNPHIPFDQLRLKVVAEQQDWPDTGQPRRAGVSSFGFGGTNAHAVIEQAPPAVPVIREADPGVTTLVLSGKSAERISSQARSLADWLQGAGAQVRLPDVAHTLSYHRERHAQFATVCVRDREQAVAQLQALADGRFTDGADGIVGPHDGPCSPGTVFVFSGQGSHWAGMGRQLLADEPVFAEAIAELDPIFVEQVGFSLQQIIADGEAISGDAQVQPVLMGLQLALTELWRSYGVHPDAVIGHSMGEVTAAVVAGALSVVDGLRVIAIRSKLMSKLAGQGAVALLKLDPEATKALIADYAGVSVAGYISPRETVIAGPVAPVDAVVAAVSAQNKFARRVNMEVASHTAFMDPILGELRTGLADLSPEIPTIPFYSTVLEGFASPMLDADYWVANVRQPALLSQAVAAAAEEHGTFIEISAHPILTHAVADTVDPASHHHSVGTLWRDGDDALRFHTNLNTVHTSHPPQTPHPVEPHPLLPTTPWHHSRFWVSPRPFNSVRTAGTVAVPVTYPDGPIPSKWYLDLAWPARELSATQRDADSSWLVVTDSGLGEEIGRVLGDEFAATVEPTSLLAEGADPSAITDALAGVTHVLYAPQVTGGQFDFEAGYELFNAARRLTSAIAEMGVAPKLYLLTRNAQPVSDGDRAIASQAVLWGLGRTLALEHPEFWGRVIDVDESVPDALAAGYVVDEAAADDDEDQVVYRAGLRRVPRLQQAPPPSTAPAELSKDHSYLVIGATGNIGPHLIQQLADSGAGTVVAVSRNPGSRLDDLTATLAPSGTTLVTAAADAADKSAMSALFDRFGKDLPPLAGIYVAAFGGGPITLLDMTADDVTAMFRPKLDVVALLHRLSLRHKVEQFVLFSSISGLTGSRWLAHYTATTTFLDTFALARRAAGLPATAINWGLWKSLSDGQSDEERQVTLASGLQPMADDVAIQALPLLTGPGAASRPVVVAADWPLLATAYRTRAALRIVDDLLLTDSAGDASPAARSTEFRDALRDADPARRRGMLADHVTGQVVGAMGLASAQLLDPTAGFFQSGMDSLMSVTLQRALSDSLGETLPASVVFDYPTVEALSDYLATLLPEVADAAEDDSDDDYDDFSDDELLKELSERLG